MICLDKRKKGSKAKPRGLLLTNYIMLCLSNLNKCSDGMLI